MIAESDPLAAAREGVATVDPAANACVPGRAPFDCRMYAATLRYACGVRLPAAPGGIAPWINDTRSPAVLLPQSPMNISPAN